MKFKSLILSVMAVATLVLAGCQKESSNTPSLSIDPTSLNFSAATESNTVTVTSNVEWKVNANTDWADWLQVTVGGESIVDKTMSTGTFSVTLTVLPNAGYERSASVVFNGGLTAKKTLTVKQEGSASYTTIADVRAMLGTEEKVTLGENIIIKGTVVSSAALNNLTSQKSLYIQDETAGINVYCSAAHSCAFGDEVTIDCSAQSLELYSKAYEINGLPIANITTLSTGNTVTPKEVSIADFVANKYEGMYVSVKDVQVAEADLAKTWVVNSDHTSINMEAKTGETFVVRSSKYSTFGTETVAQGSGTISGISTIYNTTIQLVFAQSSDYAGLTGERFQGAEAVQSTVDEVLAAASGKSVKVAGRVIALAPQGFIINDGTQNNLYIYTKTEPTNFVSDLVLIEGTTSAYGSLVEVTPTSITEYTGTIDPTPSQDYTYIADADIDAYAAKSAARVEIRGLLTCDATKGYNNVAFDGATKVGSLKSSGLYSDFDGKRIYAKGFFIGYTSSFFMILPDEVGLDNTPYFNVTPASASVQASATSTSFKINLLDTESWTATSDNADFILSETAGTGAATVTVSFPANTDQNNAKVATISVTCTLGTKTVTITQAAAGADAYTKIESVANLSEGTYYMAAYLTTDSKKVDLSAYPYHCWTGSVSGTATSNSDLITVSYSYDAGALTIKPETTGSAANVTLEKVDGKDNTYHIKYDGKYLASGASATNRRMILQDTAAEWVASDYSKGGIALCSNSVYLGTASAESNFLRSYKTETTPVYGVVFFKAE